MAKRQQFKFQDGAPMTPRDVLTGSGWGYTCLRGEPHHGSTWLPQRFQTDARAAGELLEKSLRKMTKAHLTAYVKNRGGFVGGREKKSSLMTQAYNLQYRRLFPFKQCSWSEK